MAKNSNIFLCRRMKELREHNKLTMDEMASRLGLEHRSAISRLESGNTSYATLLLYADKYCETFKYDPVQKEQFLRGCKIAVPDTSALLNDTQLVDELCKEYSHVVIPKTVIDELDNIKNKDPGSLGRRAWEIIRSIGTASNTVQRDYTGEGKCNNDCKIIYIAQQASEEFGGEVDVLTNDADYSAYLKGVDNVKALHLREYLATKQDLVSMTRIEEIDEYYALSYDDIPAPTLQEANAYFGKRNIKASKSENQNNYGYTLIISTVRNREHTLEERKAKIRWLIKHGADVNKRDCNRRYLPPLSHAIQMGDYDMFIFLLNECHANPNVASRNPYESSKVRQKNEGNMPLMIAAWEGKERFVKALCDDPRTSINQQDANGFTALIKASANKYFKCRDILLEHGADEKIVDINGKTYIDHINEAHEFGPLRTRGRVKR